MGYPLDVGGRDDYPVKVGSMLMTMVDPNKGFEKAYNRWYERDHYYEGCMIGPWMYAGSRWVAPRRLKDLRWPQENTVANPWDAGSYIAIYWVQQGHHKEHFDEWASPQVHWIYQNGRGFAERTHAHTVVMDHIGVVYRDADGVPVDLALDARYDGIVVAWFEATGGDARVLHGELAGTLMPELVRGTAIESVSSWTPSNPERDGAAQASPMPLGTRSGGKERLAQIMFVRGEPSHVLGSVRRYTDAVDASGSAKTLLVAPFLATQVGTDKYADELW